MARSLETDMAAEMEIGMRCKWKVRRKRAIKKCLIHQQKDPIAMVRSTEGLQNNIRPLIK